MQHVIKKFSSQVSKISTWNKDIWQQQLHIITSKSVLRDLSQIYSRNYYIYTYPLGKEKSKTKRKNTKDSAASGSTNLSPMHTNYYTVTYPLSGTWGTQDL